MEGRPGRRGPGTPGGGAPRDAVPQGLRTRPERQGSPARAAAPGGQRQRAVAIVTGGRRAGAAQKRGQRSALLRLPAPGGAGGGTGFASASPVAGRGMESCGPSPSACTQGSGPRVAAPH